MGACVALLTRFLCSSFSFVVVQHLRVIERFLRAERLQLSLHHEQQCVHFVVEMVGVWSGCRCQFPGRRWRVGRQQRRGVVAARSDADQRAGLLAISQIAVQLVNEFAQSGDHLAHARTAHGVLQRHEAGLKAGLQTAHALAKQTGQ